MDDLIFSINNIQDQFKALSQKPVDLPQIVVVGSQSSGKSSVLESIVRRCFLPRGSGIVTRCPLILRLVNCPKGDRLREERGVALEEWGEFDGEEQTYRIDEIQSEIERRTSEAAGGNKNISSVPIVLKIFSPDILTLTLVDLPGITKVPVGDQPHNIEEQIVALINKFIENPKSIILAVIPANTDMAANDCLKMAKKVDPEGERTLAVVTKLDLMDRGTDATDVLTGMCIPVKLGIIGVVNRAQEDIDNGKSVEAALQQEEEFLKSKYPDLAEVNGSRYLSKMLQTLLIRHIKTCLPDVKESFLQRLEECRSILEKCGAKVTDERACLHNLIGTFCTAYSKMMMGGFVDLNSLHLMGGSKLGSLFKDLEGDLNSVDPCLKYSVEQVTLAIRQTSGPEPPMIFSETAFEELMRPLIKTMREPALSCVESVAEELKEVCLKSISKYDETRFPRAIQATKMVVNEMIDKLTADTKEFVTKTIDIEEGHITHSHFLKFRNESFQDILKEENAEKLEIPFRSKTFVFKGKRSSSESNRDILKLSIQDQKHIIILGQMLQIYYSVVANRVQDTVAKATMTYLVNGLQRGMALELSAQLGDAAKKLFKENQEISTMRTQKEKELHALKNSLKELEALDYNMATEVDF